MTNSQNGWPVDTSGELQDRNPIAGARFPNGVLRGDVAVVFRYLMGRLDREVEPIKAGTCWGWFVKSIEGSASVSNHSSGTALDYNADTHPMGVRNTYSESDRAKIRAILADLSGAVRWGGDYTGRPDDMHFEIHANRTKVGLVADWIRAQEDDMALTEAQTKAAAKEAFVEVLAEAYRAATGKAGGPSPADKAARNYRDFLRTVVGGPTEDDVVNAKLAIIAQLKSIGAPVLTDAQAAQVAAGVVAAIKPVEAKVDALREHLGDDTPKS